MIDFLRGQINFIETDYVVLDVQGVGYRVFCPNPVELYNRKGTEITMYIHHHVREDAILLYGFITREEQTAFRKLLDVSGIGPKVALGILSGGSPTALAVAIQNEDITYLTKLPGIGKKTAQRMILDLKDKLGFASVEANESFGEASSASQLTGSNMSASIWNETKEALLALGYSETEIYRIAPLVKDQLSEEDSLDRALKLALQALYKQ